MDFALGFAVPENFRKSNGCRFNFRFGGILCGIILCGEKPFFSFFQGKNGRGGGI